MNVKEEYDDADDDKKNSCPAGVGIGQSYPVPTVPHKLEMFPELVTWN
jgi:hypothetical protein